MALEQAREWAQNHFGHIDYKWIALSNTTLGVLMASIDASILLISLPTIFRGIGIDPLAPAEAGYLLWTLMGYMVVTSVLLVTFGRISDMFGRVKMYNAGFAIFTIGSILLTLVQGSGDFAAQQIIFFRLIQAIGGAFLFANSAAILTDAFPAKQRGFALGVNQIAFIGGSFLGLLLGGVLAPISWRLIFLVSVPVGVVGTVWAYLMLKETAEVRKGQKLDIPGNILFAGGLIALLVSLTYGLEPYGGSPMGWGSPFVLGVIAIGLLMLAAFWWYEKRAPQPLFDLKLFSIRSFFAGNLAAFLAALARGGLQFLLIIWLQGIWLPLHGVSYEDAPFWAAVYMLPMTVMFMLFGPLSGYLSDKHGARKFAMAGMILNVIGFVGLLLLPADFSYPVFAVLLAIMGAGMGLFAAPNTATIMSSVPPHTRGVASGMRATVLNTANTLSITLVFTLLTIGLAGPLPGAISGGLTSAGVPQAAALAVAQVPPTGALFAMFLGYNPMGALLPAPVLAGLSPVARETVLSPRFFPTLLSGPFISGIALVFMAAAVLSLIAALASSMHEEKHQWKEDEEAPPDLGME